MFTVKVKSVPFPLTGSNGPFVEGASRIALDGELPLNTYGGQLSAGRMHGYWVLHEACLQLRGQAGDRQLQRRPETAVVAARGGPIAGRLVLTSLRAGPQRGPPGSSPAPPTPW